MSEPHPRPVTIYDVAHHAGVSKSLVSLVLQDSPQVSAARREAVLAAIAELDYRPSRAAAALAGRRTRTLGVVIDDFRNPWFVGLLAGIRAGLADTRINVSVADRALNTHQDETAVDGFMAARVDALVVAVDLDESEGQRLARLGVPTVVAGARSRTVPGGDQVRADEAAGAAQAVDHVYALGHRRIAHITGRGGPAAERERGYRERMTSLGLAPMTVGQGDSTDEPEAYASALALLDRVGPGERPTAILAANDTMAMGVAGALAARGLSVPGDVSLVGFDNSPLAASHLLGLTSVDNHSTAVGEATARLLLARLAHPQTPSQVVTIDTDLVIRSSTAGVGGGAPDHVDITRRRRSR